VCLHPLLPALESADRCEPATNPGEKYKKATKMVGIFVLILGVSELPIH
jgi:hypothetical protein